MLDAKQYFMDQSEARPGIVEILTRGGWSHRTHVNSMRFSRRETPDVTAMDIPIHVIQEIDTVSKTDEDAVRMLEHWRQHGRVSDPVHLQIQDAVTKHREESDLRLAQMSEQVRALQARLARQEDPEPDRPVPYLFPPRPVDECDVPEHGSKMKGRRRQAAVDAPAPES